MIWRSGGGFKCGLGGVTEPLHHQISKIIRAKKAELRAYMTARLFFLNWQRNERFVDGAGSALSCSRRGPPLRRSVTFSRESRGAIMHLLKSRSSDYPRNLIYSHSSELLLSGGVKGASYKIGRAERGLDRGPAKVFKLAISPVPLTLRLALLPPPDPTPLLQQSP